MSIHKKEAYTEAILFRKRGFTYAEIAKLCNVSRGTVSNWLRHEEFSKQIAVENKKRAITENTKRLASINKARNTERKRQQVTIMRSAKLEYKHYRQHPLFIAGLTLYLTAGDLADQRTIRLSGSVIDLHRLFIRFLVEYLAVEKQSIRFWLLLYPDLDEVTCMKHWCQRTSLSPAQFYKNQYVNSRSHKPTLHFGVGNTIISKTLQKQKLLQWLKLLKLDLAKCK